MPATPPQPTSTGLDQNIAGLLSYVLGPLTGLVFFLLEKENRFVRFHAAQSIAVSCAMFVLGIALAIVGSILGLVPVLGWIGTMLLSVGVWLVTFVLWLVLMWQAYQGKEWEAPFVGVFARRMV